MYHLWNRLQLISPEVVAVFVGQLLLLILGGVAVIRLVHLSTQQYQGLMAKHRPLTPSTARRMETLIEITNSTVRVGVILLITLIILGDLGFNLAPVVAGAGVLGVALGFGAQSLVKDIFYGFLILAENHFGIGDTIQVGSETGVVEQMTFRMIHLRDGEGRIHIIPNGELTRVILHSTDWSLACVEVRLSYESDLETALKILGEMAQQFYADHPDVFLDRPQVLGVDELGDRGLLLKITAKTKPLRQWEVTREWRRSIQTAFQKAQIVIPQIK